MSTPTPPGPASAAPPRGLADLLNHVGERARAAAVFAEVNASPMTLDCKAKASAAPASFRLTWEGDRLWAAFVTPDRWLSHSIEADLLNTGDHLEELISEELADVGHTGAATVCEHFRSEDRLFTFRTPVPLRAGDLASPSAIETASQFLLACEACFRRLGDVDTSED